MVQVVIFSKIKLKKRNKKKKKIAKKIFYFFIYLFAFCGFTFISGFFAIRFGLTNTKGKIDEKNNLFLSQNQKIEKIIDNNTNKTPKILGDLTVSTLNEEIERLDKIRNARIINYCKVEAIGEFFPENASVILKIAKKNKNDYLISQIINAIEIKISDSLTPLKEKLASCSNNFSSLKDDFPELEKKFNSISEENVFSWIKTEEWQTIKIGIIKDKEIIDKVAQTAGIESRLIISNTIVEQLRLFNSQRELFKKFFEPLKMLSSANKISLGIMGIKEQTAIKVENNLKDPSSIFYLGKEYENLLNFETTDINKERYERLTREDNHYFSYLYGALYLKQILTQWEKSGYDISQRPEIIGTLFNVGFPQSQPKADPKIGGSSIKIKDTSYSFGSLAYEFYYSGELFEEFPFRMVSNFIKIE